MKSKLVRDNIPTIIREAGKTPVVHTAKTDIEARCMTIAKMYEEVSEFEENPSLEEAADVYQVFMALLVTHDLRFDDVIRTAVHKNSTRGRFDKMIILDEILDEQG